MARSTMILRVVPRGQLQRGFEFLAVVRLGDADRRAQVGGLDEHGVLEVVLDLIRVQRATPLHDVLDHRQAAFVAQTLGHFLVHGRRGSQHARAHVGQTGEFEQTLHGAVLAEGAVQHGKHHVDAGIRAGLGQNRARRPAAVLADQETLHLVACRVQRGDNRFGRAQRDLVLAAAPAVYNSDT